MSAPITPTEEHLALAEQLIQISKMSEIAQLIAESEARAISSLAMVTAESADRNVSLRLENDQLRAEVERLTKQIKDDNRAFGCELRDPYGTIWEQATKDHARAERAEAELKQVDETAKAMLQIADERAEKAEEIAERYRLVTLNQDAELAAERERVRALKEKLASATRRLPIFNAHLEEGQK